MSKHITSAALALLVALGACSGGEKTPSQTTPEKSAPPSTGAVSSVKPTGRVITVELYSDEKGNYFKPAEIEAHPGDLVRFTLKSGVHNVHFLPDSNPGAQGLPPVSDFLQIPEQTYDYLVSLPKGHYYFQCDPHALLGMKGRLEVED